MITNIENFYEKNVIIRYRGNETSEKEKSGKLIGIGQSVGVNKPIIYTIKLLYPLLGSPNHELHICSDLPNFEMYYDRTKETNKLFWLVTGKILSKHLNSDTIYTIYNFITSDWKKLL